MVALLVVLVLSALVRHTKQRLETLLASRVLTRLLTAEELLQDSATQVFLHAIVVLLVLHVAKESMKKAGYVFRASQVNLDLAKVLQVVLFALLAKLRTVQD